MGAPTLKLHCKFLEHRVEAALLDGHGKCINKTGNGSHEPPDRKMPSFDVVSIKTCTCFPLIPKAPGSSLYTNAMSLPMEEETQRPPRVSRSKSYASATSVILFILKHRILRSVNKQVMRRTAIFATDKLEKNAY